MASNDYAKAGFIGRLGADAEVKLTANGRELLSFNVGVGRWVPQGQDPKTTWVRCTIWQGALFDSMVRLIEGNGALGKGDLVFVEGDPDVSAYVNNQGEAVATQELNVREIKLLTPRKNGGEGGR